MNPIIQEAKSLFITLPVKDGKPVYDVVLNAIDFHKGAIFLLSCQYTPFLAVLLNGNDVDAPELLGEFKKELKRFFQFLLPNELSKESEGVEFEISCVDVLGVFMNAWRACKCPEFRITFKEF